MAAFLGALNLKGSADSPRDGTGVWRGQGKPEVEVLVQVRGG